MGLGDFLFHAYTFSQEFLQEKHLRASFSGGIVVKNLPVNAGDTGDTSSIPGSGRSPRGGNGILLQYPCLKIPWTEEPGGLQSMGSQRVRRD